MMILDAINGASSRHAIYFLVTAYLESLNHYHRGMGIPDPVVKLPVKGIADLEERLECLRRKVPVPSERAAPAAAEVSAVLASAVNRLACEPAQAGENR